MRHAVLHMLDALTNGETYEENGKDDLLKIKSIVREKSASLLATMSTEAAATFLLELLLLATSTERTTVTAEEPQEPLQKASNESLPEAKLASSTS